MHRGYIKLWRASVDNPLYFVEPFTKWQAWCDLLLLANHRPHDVSIRGILVHVGTGQALAGEDYLAIRWKWSRGKVRRFLSHLASKTVQQIVQQKSNVCSTITVLNWTRYQSHSTADSTANGTTDGQQTVQQTDTPKNEENVKKDKNKTPIPPKGADYPSDFLEFWKLYPLKKGKAIAYKKFQTAIKKVTLDAMLHSIAEQKTWREWTKDGGKFVKYPATWLNQECWDDEKHEPLKRERPVFE